MMKRNFKRNQQGLLMYFVVVIMALALIGLMWFFYATGIQAVQEAFNEDLGSDRFATTGNWNSFDLANTFINNIWTFFLVFLVIGLAYYGYIEAQRRR